MHRAHSTIDRILVGVAVGSAVAALLAFGAVLVATFAGADAGAWSSPAWIAIFDVAYWGLPLAIAAIIAVVVRNAARRRRPDPDGAPSA